MFRRAAVFGLCLVSAGCSLFGPRFQGPDGLSPYDDDLRHLVGHARYEAALDLAESEADAAGDDLLALLNIATVEHYAGEYRQSNARFQAADIEVDKRFTKSVSKAALSLLTNDRSLAWIPSRHERPMLHVYGALSYLALGEHDEAAVEARRLSMLLDRMSDGELEGEEYGYYLTLRYFAGAVFESAGEFNDAGVAYRHAGMDPPPDISRSDAGAIVVLVETGFVASRLERSVNLLLDADDADYLRSGSDRARYRAASCLSGDRLDFAYESFGVSSNADDCPPRERRRKTRRDDEDDDGEDVAYLLRVAWPVMKRSVESPYVSAMRTRVSGEDEPATGAVISADLSGAAIRDFNSRAPGILVKALARAAVKYAVVDAVADDSEVAQVVGNAVAALLERADTRGWTLLPSDLHLLRLHAAPGVHDVVVEFSEDGRSSGPLVIEDVQVEPGRLTVVSIRAWP